MSSISEVEQNKKSVQFQENAAAKTVETKPEDVEINEGKIDRLLHLLHEADPSDAQHDTQEMLNLEGILFDKQTCILFYIRYSKLYSIISR